MNRRRPAHSPPGHEVLHREHVPGAVPQRSLRCGARLVEPRRENRVRALLGYPSRTRGTSEPLRALRPFLPSRWSETNVARVGRWGPFEAPYMIS
eukprot:1175335-Prorocentrum_minimum.AAC.2